MYPNMLKKTWVSGFGVQPRKILERFKFHHLATLFQISRPAQWNKTSSIENDSANNKVCLTLRPKLSWYGLYFDPQWHGEPLRLVGHRAGL